jgi:hypothetical protein
MMHYTLAVDVIADFACMGKKAPKCSAAAAERVVTCCAGVAVDV